MDSQDEYFQRIKELQDQGLDSFRAFSRANLENHLKNWPSGWGDDLQIVLYGDFIPATNDIIIDSLGISIFCEPQKKTVIRTAITVLKANVQMKDHTIDSLLNAIQRINTLCGIWTLINWCNSPLCWWCYMIHGAGGGSLPRFDEELEGLQKAIPHYRRIHPAIRQRLDAALYWIRASQLHAVDTNKRVLNVYSDFWNAFECLVEAVHLSHPETKLSPSEKQQKIDEFVQKRSGALTPRDITICFREIVDRGFRGKAKHALSICFRDDYEHYFDECFTRKPREDRLYSVRNAINHGDIDAENPDEISRVTERLSTLKMLVMMIFALFIPYKSPDGRRRFGILDST